MNVRLAKTAGFCYGVRRAVELAERAAGEGPVYLLGHLTHNDHVIRRLEDMGHLRREVDPDNRRQYQLYLTGAGRDMLPLLEAAYQAFSEKLSAGISGEDWQTLQALLKRLEENSCPEG